ncbi:MAG TPA: alpha-L-rhamnosidase N-terminal domain-containing protein, partial [Chitinophagaceae bacterium]|nr:alpha-L-rhamnosidase N-terminal domain-containing protein [Chitinophagaceae bacterium]
MTSSRREFIQQSLLTGSSLLLSEQLLSNTSDQGNPLENFQPLPADNKLDLAPANWIWLPAQRTLPNTLLFFRKKIAVKGKLNKATGWILGESRYKLYVNGKRIQFGTAPADPRWPEADPFDITSELLSGENMIGAEVLFYGFGDGTWPIGKPGFIFKMELEYENGMKEIIVSNNSWQVKPAQSWRPGQYKRWYLRAFQEEFDARLYPFGWNTTNDLSEGWLTAALLQGHADQPALATNSNDYLYDAGGYSKEWELRKRSIKLLKEEKINVKKLTEQYWLKWKLPPEEYFQFLLPEKHCFDIVKSNVAALVDGRYHITAGKDKSAVLTFELEQQHVGFPFFSIDAPEGTIVELLVHEAHTPGSGGLMNSHFNSWTRFTCKAGINNFETFDYESFRWMQLHIRNAEGNIVVSEAGIRRRVHDWQHLPFVKTDDSKLQKLLEASVNTMHNCCQETIVDGMARERQQYSGDLGHMVHALLYGMDAKDMVARYLITFSQGLTAGGFFLDCWPAYDRLARLQQRELGMTSWGPLLDHGVGFVFDSYYYYRYTGDTRALQEVFPRLVRFYQYLLTIIRKDDLAAVENIGIPHVWLDHEAYLKQRHKQCAFNLYISAMLQYAFSPLCIAFNEPKLSAKATELSKRIRQAVIKKYWRPQQKTFINNLPWLSEEGEPRMCDRSLATAILFDMIPEGNSSMAKILLNKPANLGISYPANA